MWSKNTKKDDQIVIRSTGHFTVNRADIEEMSRRVERFLREEGLGRREIERVRLTMETLLQRVSEQLGWGTACELTLGCRLGRAYVSLSYPGAAFDPTLIGRESEGDAWSAQLLADMGFVPLWSWRRGVNRLVFRPPERARSAWTGPGVAAVLAVALGVLGASLPATRLEQADRLVLTPVLNCFFGVFGACAGLMIFFRVIAILCGAGDTLSLGRMGKVALGRFLALTCLWAAIGTAGMAVLYRTSFRTATYVPHLVPRDPFSPFMRGDLGQIFFLALMAGAVVFALGERAGRVREWAEQCAGVCVSILESICRLSPLLVFAALLRLIARGSFVSLLGLWKPLAAFALCALVILTVKLSVTSVKRKEPVAGLIKRLLPTFWAAFSAASSTAVFGRTMDNCENELGVPHELVLVGLPIGNLLCAPTTALCFSAVLLYLTERFGVSVNPLWLALLALVSALTAMALPPVRGALLICFGMLLTQFGLPVEGFSVMAVLNVLLDPAATAVSNAYLQLELMSQADRLEWKRR